MVDMLVFPIGFVFAGLFLLFLWKVWPGLGMALLVLVMAALIMWLMPYPMNFAYEQGWLRCFGLTAY